MARLPRGAAAAASGVRKASTRAPKGKAPSAVYQLKVTLRHVRPPIWRRVLVPSGLTLARLHHVLQIAMGWTNSHLHAFQVGELTYGMSDLDSDLDFEPEEKARVGQVLPGEKSRLVYEYDFGDSWEHEVLVEKVLPPEAAPQPQCVDGRRACPPEDCGGVSGYAFLLEVLADPKHPEHEGMREWAGEDFDPEHFDAADVNARLARRRW
jgi:hypothetical protein